MPPQEDVLVLESGSGYLSRFMLLRRGLSLFHRRHPSILRSRRISPLRARRSGTGGTIAPSQAPIIPTPRNVRQDGGRLARSPLIASVSLVRPLQCSASSGWKKLYRMGLGLPSRHTPCCPPVQRRRAGQVPIQLAPEAIERVIALVTNLEKLANMRELVDEITISGLSNKKTAIA